MKESEGLKNFYFSMPVSLWDRLRAESNRTGDASSEIIRKAVDSYLLSREIKR